VSPTTNREPRTDQRLTAIPIFLPFRKWDKSNWNCGRCFSTFLNFLFSSRLNTLVNSPSPSPVGASRGRGELEGAALDVGLAADWDVDVGVDVEGGDMGADRFAGRVGIPAQRLEWASWSDVEHGRGEGGLSENVRCAGGAEMCSELKSDR
jgi:hypothetical protein